MTPSHVAPGRRELRPASLRRATRRVALARCASILAPLFGAALLAAERPAPGAPDSLTTGLRYDIQLTSTSMGSQDGQPAASTTSGLAHVEIANRKVRIDVAEGDFAAVATAGDFLIFTDTSHTATVVKPDVKQYFQVDFQKLGARLTGTVNAFGGAVGAQASNVKLNFASLGPGDKVGPFSTGKYRITQDYLLTVSFLGANQGKGTTMHSTADYWFAPELTSLIVNPFANVVQESAWLGATYGQQLGALQAKLPKGVPVKTIMTDVATDSAGTKTTTTVTWELTNFIRADIPDAAYEIPAGFTPLQAPTALLQPIPPGGAATPGAAANGNPAAGLVNMNALQAAGGTSPTGALSTLLKAAQGGAPPGGASGSAAGAPATTWNGNGSAPSGGSGSAWSAATSATGSPGAGQNATSPAPATSAQDTTTPATRKGHSQ